MYVVGGLLDVSWLAPLGFVSYRTGEREEQQVVTYLFQLHRDLALDTKGLGSLLESEVEAIAIDADESIMLTVAVNNTKARAFYGRLDYWLDKSSPQNYSRPVEYMIMRKVPTEGESLAQRDARFWDHFYDTRRAFRQFESDDDDYRKARGVELFNAGQLMNKDVKVLRPTLQSACPHVLWAIVTRQIVEMGDPLRRGCDQSEAIGANMKGTIHRRVARNKIDPTGKGRTHHKRDASGAVVKSWTQILTCSRVMQAFRSECVRERIIRDPASEKYLQRKHFRLLTAGRSSKAVKRAREEAEAGIDIPAAVAKRVRGLREEGGEPGV